MGETMNKKYFLLWWFTIVLSFWLNLLQSQEWKVNSDYWSATDALGRQTPTRGKTGPTRDGKFIGMFYWTWHTDMLADFSPINISEILAQYPEAANDANHSAWQGIWGGVFWWDEPLFGYYRTTDEWILRKHAELLADAGVDVVFFDCTNGSYTWKTSYMKLLQVWEQARKDGVKTPKIAFLLAFSPTDGAFEAIKELYSDLYQPQLFKNLWFYWKGKPLIMAYPEMLKATPGDQAALKFTANSSFLAIDVHCPSWSNNIGNLTLTLYKWKIYYSITLSGNAIVQKTFENYNDNTWLKLDFEAQEPGDYLWLLSNPTEVVGVWKDNNSQHPATSFFNRTPTTGDYECRIYTAPGSKRQDLIPYVEPHIPVQLKSGSDVTLVNEIKNFFTFRPGQPDYVNGPSRSDQWGWLENYPQHGYVGKKSFEQVTVGVAQNANDASGGHCYAFNAPGTYGRSYTQTNGQDPRPDAYLYGLNFAEQWGRAFELDPELVFITGWNEWIAGRHESWPPSNPHKPFAFPDQYDWDKSRDLEPVKSWGNKGDVYYIQLINNVRKFKGMKIQEPASAEKTINIGTFENWDDVKPEYWHYQGNTQHRNHRGQGDQLVYTNNTGRNDIALAKVGRGENNIYFYVETAENLTPKTDPQWMRLFIDIDRNKATGWEGYDYFLNRKSPGDSIIIEKSTTEWNWEKVGAAAYAVADKAIELKIKKSILGLADADELNFEFKWSDNMQETGNIMDFYINGDAAPGGRFNFIYQTEDITGLKQNPGELPKKFALQQNYPNPFNAKTEIRYHLPETGHTSIEIYNVVGQKIKTMVNKSQVAGSHAVCWNAADDQSESVSSGIYFYQLKATGGTMAFNKIKRMVFLK